MMARATSLSHELETGATSPVSILCEWAGCKAQLQSARKAGSPEAIQAAIVAFRRALRRKQAIDELYREHHEKLAAEEARARPAQLHLQIIA